MAVRIPTYQQQTTPSGNFQQVQADAPSAGGGFGALADAFSGAANIVNQMDDRDARAAAAKAASQAELDEASNLDKESSAAVADPTGFGGKYIEGLDKRNEQRLDQYSGRTRQYLSQMLPNMRTQFGSQAIAFESGARRGKAATDLGTAYDNTMAAVASGVLSKDEGVARSKQLLADYDAGGLADPKVAEKLRGNIDRDGAWYSYQSRIRSDPEGVMRSLGINPSRSSLVGNTTAEKIYNATSQDYGSFGAAAIVGGLRAEQGEFNPNASHDNGSGVGIAGWRQERRDALRAFASSRGTTETDLDTQIAFVNHELSTTESDVGQRLKNAKSPEEAARIFVDYERPAGWKKGDVSGASQLGNRIAYAMDAYDAFGGKNAGIVPSPDSNGLSPNDVVQLSGQAETQMKAKRAENRALFDASVDNDVAAFQAGAVVSQPKTLTDFLANYEPADATVKYRAYNVEQQTGLAVSGFKGKSDQDINTTVNAMEPKDPSVSDYAFRREAWQAAQRAQYTIATQRAADPGGYVQRNMTTVNQAWQDYAADPTKLSQAIAITTQAQNQLGIPPSAQQAVPKSVRDAMVDGVTRATPSQAWQQLNQWSQQLGDQKFDQLFRTLSTGDGALSRDYQTLAVIKDPTAAQAWVTALTAARDNHTSVSETAAKTMGPDEFKSLKSTIDGSMQDYYNTLRWQGAGALINQQSEAALGIAVYSPSKNGGANADIGVKALTDQYDVLNESSIIARAPAGTGSRMASVADTVRQRLQAGQLTLPGADPSGAYPTEALSEDATVMAHDGMWTNDAGYTGWVLRSATSHNIIRYKDGTPVALRFADLPLWEMSIKAEQRPSAVQGGVEQQVPAPRDFTTGAQ